jgi:glycosyltransferase involved in cell wall biosynthesis
VPNGIVTYVGNLRPGLARLGVTSSVLTTTHVLGDADPAAIAVGGTRRPLIRRAVFKLARRLGGPRAFGLELGWDVAQGALALGKERPLDLVELEETFGAAYYAQQSLRVPVVVRAHGPWFLNGTALGVPRDAQYRWRNREERRGFACADGVTSPSRDVLERVRSQHDLPLRDAAVIPNPVPVIPADRRWQLSASDGKSILFVGRFDRHKGGDIVIDAFRRVAELVPEARLIFVGPDRGLSADDGRAHSLSSYVEAALPVEARARVEVTGALPAEAIDALRRRAFLTVVASRYETFSFALAESMAFGCPTIGAATGAIPEILLGDRTGLLFDAGDADSLATRIIALFRDRVRAAELGSAAAADMVARFSPDTVARATLDHYAEVIARARARQRPHAARWLWGGLYAATGLV